MSHFLFVGGALRERSSLESVEIQLAQGVWGLRTALLRENLTQFLTSQSQGLVYALKVGICARFFIISPVLPFGDLDELIQDDLRGEAKNGFVRIRVAARWESTPAQTHALLQRVLNIEEAAELSRRLSLGMHRLTEEEFQSIVEGLEPMKSGG
jgi:hypothetical protein